MERKILILAFLLCNLGFLKAQEIEPLESSKGYDLVTDIDFQNGFLKYFVSYSLDLDLLNLPQDSIIHFYSIKVIDLDSKSITEKKMWSKGDSLNYGIPFIQSSKIDTFYYIRTFSTDFNDYTQSTYYLVETDHQFSFENEYLIEIPTPIYRWLGGFFDKQGRLILTGRKESPEYQSYILEYDATDLNTLELLEYQEFDSFGPGQQFPLLPVNDSLSVRLSDLYYYNIYYFDEDYSPQDTFFYATEDASSYILTRTKSTVVDDGNLYFTGIKTIVDISGFPDIVEYEIVYNKIHPLYSDTTIELFLDTLPDETYLSNVQLDFIDKNHIYNGLNYTNCWGAFSDCYNALRFYSTTSTGEVNWTYDIGGDANYFMKYVVATPDTGMLAIFQYYNPLEPEYKSETYWIKFNKDGTQDLEYLSGFSEVLSGIKPYIEPDSRVKISPNPSNGEVLFEFTIQNKSGEIQIYNTLGQLLETSKVGASQVEQQLDLKHLPKGLYYWRFGVESGRLVIH